MYSIIRPFVNDDLSDLRCVEINTKSFISMCMYVIPRHYIETETDVFNKSVKPSILCHGIYALIKHNQIISHTGRIVRKVYVGKVESFRDNGIIGRLKEHHKTVKKEWDVALVFVPTLSHKHIDKRFTDDVVSYLESVCVSKIKQNINLEIINIQTPNKPKTVEVYDEDVKEHADDAFKQIVYLTNSTPYNIFAEEPVYYKPSNTYVEQEEDDTSFTESESIDEDVEDVIADTDDISDINDVEEPIVVEPVVENETNSQTIISTSDTIIDNAKLSTNVKSSLSEIFNETITEKIISHIEEHYVPIMILYKELNKIYNRPKILNSDAVDIANELSLFFDEESYNSDVQNNKLISIIKSALKEFNKNI